jgi:hypothetical protein
MLAGIRMSRLGHGARTHLVIATRSALAILDFRHEEVAGPEGSQSIFRHLREALLRALSKLAERRNYRSLSRVEHVVYRRVLHAALHTARVLDEQGAPFELGRLASALPERGPHTGAAEIAADWAAWFALGRRDILKRFALAWAPRGARREAS